MGSTFLSNDALWQEFATRVRKSRRVDAAIAYLGKGGADLLKLRKGHRIVVDLSPRILKAGSTDPWEIEKLLRRGVRVFARAHLHSKVIVFDNAVISSSANVSNRSRDLLDEAGILSSENVVVQRARDFVDRMCLEPVGFEYLERCKEVYRPPRFHGENSVSGDRRKRVQHAKLWIVNLKLWETPDEELARLEAGEEAAHRLVHDPAKSDVEYFTWSNQPQFSRELELGDNVIQVIRHSERNIEVRPAGRFLRQINYIRKRRTKKRRWAFFLEMRRRPQTITWGEFRRHLKRILGRDTLASPRTMPIRDIAAADRLLALWTASGKIAAK